DQASFDIGAAGVVLHPVAGDEGGEDGGPLLGRDLGAGRTGAAARFEQAAEQRERGGQAVDPDDRRDDGGVVSVGSVRRGGQLDSPGGVASLHRPLPLPGRRLRVRQRDRRRQDRGVGGRRRGRRGGRHRGGRHRGGRHRGGR